MSSTPRNLTALIGSRICHDLISPLGAIGNGVELLQLSGVDESPEFKLITKSVENANTRIRYFRVAFGSAAPGQVISEKEVQAVLSPGHDGRKTELVWHPSGDLPRTEAKLALLTLQCFESAMPFGGQIEVSNTDGQWQFNGTADRLNVEPTLWSLISQPDSDIQIRPAQVHFVLLGLELDHQGRSPDVKLAKAQINVAF